MDCHVTNNQCDLNIDVETVQAIVAATISHEGLQCDEVGIHFVDTAEISSLHLQHFNDPTPTDCISFPIDDPYDSHDYCVLGDVFVCPETAVKYAAHHKSEPYLELTLYIVHGLLHLMGYDDIEDKDKATMQAAEKRHMLFLQESNLYLHP